ncbi:MAG: TonB-dependent receptor [Ignavibacteriae bacterium]|nr:MAG: TonB-dependent receptor [Ignavibacteriota bacterium]
MTNHIIQRAWYVSTLLLFTFTALFAQNVGKISGVVTDAQNGEPLIGANIIVLGTSLGAATDIEGNFFILNIPAGKYDLQASLIGYTKVVHRDVIVNSARTTDAAFKLKGTTLETEAVTIEATRPDVEREKASTSMIVRTEDVQQIAGMRNVSDILGLAADVSDGHFRGGRSGEVLYTMQGMGIINPLDNSSSIDPIMSAVEEVEVVTSGFGSQYGNTQSGVVNISMKEGKSDKWHSFADVRLRGPSKKHFGASPWDENANPYLKIFLDPSRYTLWVSDGLVDKNYGYSRATGSGMRLLRDTAQLAQVAILLNKQSFNNTNRSYGNKPDYSVEISTGGPLSETVRMFIAANTKISWPVLATEEPDESNLVMGNMVMDAGNGGSLRVSGSYSHNNQQRISTSSTGDYFNFLYSMFTGNQYQKSTNGQLGLRFAKTVSKNTFYEIKLNGLSTRNQTGSRNCIPDTMRANQILSTAWLARPAGAPAGYSAIAEAVFGDQKTQTVSLDASLSSQVTTTHYINAGIQANAYFIDVDNRSAGSMIHDWTSTTKYYAKPIELSIYAQDKMEFEGMIATVGLRLDGWAIRANYGLFSPDSAYTMNKETPIKARLQPRVGFSFPVSVNTVFHVNYGSYIQRPAIQYMLQKGSGTNTITVPNPNLEPQVTNSYDIGIMNGFGDGFTLDISAYYKNVSDLIRQVYFRQYPNNDPLGSGGYYTYMNLDYADIRGFHVSLKKRNSNFNGSLDYTYGVNTGSSASPTATLFTYSKVVTGGQITLSDNSRNGGLPDQEIPLDYDRTHNLILNLSYITSEDFGFKIGGTRPLSDISLSLNSTYSSGRPYSYGHEIMNNRTPDEYNTDMKISKRIKNIFGTTLTVYAEIFNLFNDRIWNYNYIFRSSATAEPNSATLMYMTKPFAAPDGLLYNSTNTGIQDGIGTDQSFVLWTNQPRSYWFGLSIEF